MNEMNQEQTNSRSDNTDADNRREAIRKLGKYAAYAAPFTLVAVNASASQGGSAVGGRSSGAQAAEHRR